MPDELVPDTVVHSVVFGDPWIEIAYQQSFDHTQRVQTMRQTAIDRELVKEELEEIVGAIVDILNTALTEQRLER